MSVIDLKIEDNATRLLEQAGRQVPFALALSLTKVAQLAQDAVRQQIVESFVLRRQSRGFLSSIRIKPATKKNLNAEVYTKAEFAALQQSGGIKHSHRGMLAIPVYDEIGKVQRITKRTSPSGVLANGAFEMRFKSGKEVIAQRDKARGLHILYFLKQQAHVPKRLKMIETTKSIVQTSFAFVFNKTLTTLL